MTKAKVAKPMTGRKLWRATIREIRGGWKLYFGTVLLITLPVGALSLSTQLAADNGFVGYVTFASAIMNLALLSIAWRRLQQQSVTLRQAYYDGTAYLVRFIIVSLVIALCLVPAAFGAELYQAGQSVDAPVGELVVLGLAGLLVASIGIWLLVRYVFALVISANADVRPMASLKSARGLTLGRFWAILGRLIILLLGVAVIAAVAYGVVIIVSLFVHNLTVLDDVYQFIAGLIILPPATIYLTILYNDLAKSAPAPR